MATENNIFDDLAGAFIQSLTYFINAWSGLLQLIIYFLIFTIFCFALLKALQTFRILVRCDAEKLLKAAGASESYIDIKTPLAIIAASFFIKTKRHYLREKEQGNYPEQMVPPDAFVRDAAFQFSDRYIDEKFIEPIAMLANLLPPIGFIGTIIGMVIHFLSNSGSLNSDITVAGIATALYTTFIGLICFTSLEFLRKIFHTLAHRRIDEGLTTVNNHIQRVNAARSRKTADEK
ncbi:MAG TPA: MotA/TolQ/ExbB proton channel family protein [Geopsychrobacteraceae bacterium]|nr:MotA/TolQ/ExbB proton channel family protein [Geopsychrobacteraceae bacterium]